MIYIKLINKLILPVVFLTATVAVIFNINTITNYVADILEKHPKIVIPNSNEYAKDYDFEFIKFSKDYIPYSFQDIKNIFFSVINNGWNSFTFYCPSEYKDCLSDVELISEDEILLTNINNFTHPFNNFHSIETTYYDTGEINLKINKLYSTEKINSINSYVDKVMQEVLKETDMTTEEKIKEIHDYIIKNTNYDINKNNTGSSQYESNTAYGVFFEKYGICSGYTDAMAIFLARLDIKNFKIASDTHVWNAVYINDEWLHLDLTWDDPVSSDGKENLWHKYFLIKTEKFIELDTKNEDDHKFNKAVYLEFKN